MKQDLNQPHEDPPGAEVNRRIDELQKLRRKLRFARHDYLVAPTKQKEIALQWLIRQESEMSFDVGFGANPVAEYGRDP